jgi:hypothetical protein
MSTHHRSLLSIACAALIALAALLPNSARAGASYQPLAALLVDLSGWTAGKPDGMAMEMNGATMITATRHYERGEAQIDAQIVTGPAAQGSLAAAGSTMKMETSEGRMTSGLLDGFQVTRTYTFSDKSGGIIVGLRDNALFSVSFNGIADDEALALAKKFDWKAIQAAIGK